MTRFFSISDNSFDNEGFPWIARIVTGLLRGRECPECGAPQEEPSGNLAVILEPNVGTRWPDVFGCGSYPLLIVSERVLRGWQAEGVGQFPVDRVEILDPLPRTLLGSTPPAYFWLHGEQMIGARVDFDASAFVGVRFCSTCGVRSDDVRATHRRQHSGPWSYVFVAGTWNGANLFTTDISPTAFFCTEAVVECARKHRHTNFRFAPADANQNHVTGWGGVDYLGAKWPPQWYPPAPSAGKSVEEWLNELGCGDPKREYEAVCAVLDLWDQAVPGLSALLRSSDKRKRLEAAHLLASRPAIDRETEQLITQVYRDWVQDIVQQYAEEAVPIILNDLKTGPDVKKHEITEYLGSLKGRRHKYAHLMKDIPESN